MCLSSPPLFAVSTPPPLLLLLLLLPLLLPLLLLLFPRVQQLIHTPVTLSAGCRFAQAAAAAAAPAVLSCALKHPLCCLQELLLLLDDYWQAHPELRHVPLYQVSTEGRGGGEGERSGSRRA